jgi:hypothetical protein
MVTIRNDKAGQTNAEKKEVFAATFTEDTARKSSQANLYYQPK